MGLGTMTRAFAAKGMQRLDDVTRETVEEAGRRVVEELSPVGDPVLWKNPYSAPPGYVGGQFRSNWNYGLDEIDRSTTTETGIHTVNGLSAMPQNAAGHKHYVANSLPYAQALEYRHSSQAPAGIIAIIAIELPGIAEAAARKAAQ